MANTPEEYEKETEVVRAIRRAIDLKYHDGNGTKFERFTTSAGAEHFAIEFHDEVNRYRITMIVT